jgi:hypothetical protein
LRATSCWTVCRRGWQTTWRRSGLPSPGEGVLHWQKHTAQAMTPSHHLCNATVAISMTGVAGFRV